MSTLMDVKTKKEVSEKKKLKDPFTFFNQLKEELKKVSWTTRQELLLATKLVIFATFAFGIGIYGVDLFIKGSLELVKKIFLFLF